MFAKRVVDTSIVADNLSLLTVSVPCGMADNPVNGLGVAEPPLTEMEAIKQFIEWSATGIELATIILIIFASIFGTLRFLLHLNRTVPDAYSQYKIHLGKMLILALEFMVAADIIRTVALDQTLGNILTLGLLVLIRTFLSWSLTLEIEGRWPWQTGGTANETEANEK